MKKSIIITVIIIAVIAAAMGSLALSVSGSKALLTKQQGGIPDSAQTYEYYTFEGQSSSVYQKILSAKYKADRENDIKPSAYMCLLVDNELTALPDSYLYSNYSEFDVKCDIAENSNKMLKLHFSGNGVSADNTPEDISFYVTVDWEKVMNLENESVYIEAS